MLEKIEGMETEYQNQLRDARKTYEENFLVERSKFFSDFNLKKNNNDSLFEQEKKILE